MARFAPIWPIRLLDAAANEVAIELNRRTRSSSHLSWDMRRARGVSRAYGVPPRYPRHAYF
jgi:hypothetical protein